MQQKIRSTELKKSTLDATQKDASSSKSRFLLKENGRNDSFHFKFHNLSFRKWSIHLNQRDPETAIREHTRWKRTLGKKSYLATKM